MADLRCRIDRQGPETSTDQKTNVAFDLRCSKRWACELALLVEGKLEIRLDGDSYALCEQRGSDADPEIANADLNVVRFADAFDRETCH